VQGHAQESYSDDLLTGGWFSVVALLSGTDVCRLRSLQYLSTAAVLQLYSINQTFSQDCIRCYNTKFLT